MLAIHSRSSKKNTDKLTYTVWLIIIAIGFSSASINILFTNFVPYSSSKLHFSDQQSQHSFSFFLAWFFLLPVFSGFIGQKYSGHYLATLSGIFISIIGFICLFIANIFFFHFGIVLTALGLSLYNTNIFVIFNYQFSKNTLGRANV